MQAPCYERFYALEELHRKQINDLQQQHQKEVAALLKEKDQQLKEETAATVTGREKTIVQGLHQSNENKKYEVISKKVVTRHMKLTVIFVSGQMFCHR